MIKKKNAAKEVSEEKIKEEQSDNKENKDTKEAVDQTLKENSAETETTENTAGSKEKESLSADKVVASEPSFEEKLAEMQDKYIRLSAEFDNYRKRTLREKMELSKYASENILLQIIPFMDDFERALKNMGDTKDYDALKEGINLIHMKFKDFLKQNGVTEIDALNCPFNFDLHDAVAKVQAPEEDKKGKVIDVVQKGYYLLDKVIRHSKVVVGE